MTLPVMSVGGVGVISVMANVVPGSFSRMVHTAQSSVARAQAVWADLEELGHLLFAEGNPSGVKTALSITGVCLPAVRLPLVEGSPRLSAAMRPLLTAVG